MLDKTKNKIIDAAMSLIMERGYSATTTKDIAKKAGINECTIFRKFNGKKEIVLSAMKLNKYNPSFSEDDFKFCGDLEKDLILFSEIYMKKVTPKMVKISIGLRTPELYEYTADEILKVPKVCKDVLVKYFKEMESLGIIKNCDLESAAISFLSMNFGFVFFKASFGDKLTEIKNNEYINENVKIFIKGIIK
ncbi:MAG: helix-turn-helix domain-containing protein [Lachnospirales bacterium]